MLPTADIQLPAGLTISLAHLCHTCVRYRTYSLETRQSAHPDRLVPATKTQLRPEFLQKDRPSLVPQQAVIDVRDSQSRALYVPIMFPNVKP
jgi:hypothetical protein